MPRAQSQVSRSLTGIAGVHFVVSELSRRGLIALPTTRNTAGIDVVVTNYQGSWHANIQVKTSKNKASFWLVGKNYRRHQGKRNYFAFVRFIPDSKLNNDGYFEAFLESADNVIKITDKRHRKNTARGKFGIGPSWHLPTDPVKLKKLRKNWLNLGKNK